MELARFLANNTPCARRAVRWGESELAVAVYVSVSRPPAAYVTSVRAIVLREGEVLVVRDPTGTHCTPGGRREPGEPPLVTLRREVLEETGWTLARIRRLGFLHYHHLTPQPQDYAYPYPDFLQAVYAARAGKHRPEARESGGYELEASFRPVSEVLASGLGSTPRCLLDAALNIWDP